MTRGVKDHQIQKINSIAEKILASGSIGATTKSILEHLKSELDAFAGVIFLHDPDKHQIYAFAYTESKIIYSANKILGRDPFGIRFSVKEKEPLMVKSFTENRIIVHDSLADFFAPVINSRTLNLIQKFLGVKMCLSSPVQIKGKAVGCLFMVFKHLLQGEQDLEIVQLYANMSGIALENYRNMEKLQKQYEAEKEASAILTHELKTPISIAYNSSELLGLTLKKYSNAFNTEFVEKVKNQQLEIQESILRMNMICNSIFSMTEVENNLSIENQKLDLDESIGRLVRVYKTYKQDDLKFNYVHKVRPGSYFGPAVQFEQVISIILENAFKYTKKGRIEMELVMDGMEMWCTITDTGPGISEEEKKKVFDRFYRSPDRPKSQRGLGLGLYIAKKIAEKLHGNIELKDNPHGHGSRFVIKFPVYKKK